jgi:hypothetical protein
MALHIYSRDVRFLACGYTIRTAYLKCRREHQLGSLETDIAILPYWLHYIGHASSFCLVFR